MAQISTRRAAYQQLTTRAAVSTTASTTVLSFQAIGRDTLFDVAGVVAVTTSTDLTATVAWTDPDVGSLTHSWYTASAQTKGAAQLAQQQVLVKAGTTGTVSVTTTVSGAIRPSSYARSA